MISQIYLRAAHLVFMRLCFSVLAGHVSADAAEDTAEDLDAAVDEEEDEEEVLVDEDQLQTSVCAGCGSRALISQMVTLQCRVVFIIRKEMKMNQTKLPISS